MREYTLSLARVRGYKHEEPERTAVQVTGFNYRYKVWTNRRALAKTVRMQQKRTPHILDWSPIIPLTDGEGY